MGRRNTLIHVETGESSTLLRCEKRICEVAVMLHWSLYERGGKHPLIAKTPDVTGKVCEVWGCDSDGAEN